MKDKCVLRAPTSARLLSCFLLGACAGGATQDPDAPLADAMLQPDALRPPDAILPDGRPDPSASIRQARGAVDGPANVELVDVLVTYVKPFIGDDVPGFFVQIEQLGPALYIAVDPSTLSPVPTAGDMVSFTITNMATTHQLRQADAIADFAQASSGHDLEALVQPVDGAPDLVTALDSYESELIAVDATILAPFSAAGSGFSSAPVGTAFVSDPNLVLRLPDALLATVESFQTCRITVFATPLWRADEQAQLSAWAVADIRSNVCPGPAVVMATATSSTRVNVTFTKPIDPGTVLADGSQFVFDGGLVATGATTNGTVVTVGTTTQAPSMPYTVTVATTVADTTGHPLESISDRASFTGF